MSQLQQTWARLPGTEQTGRGVGLGCAAWPVLCLPSHKHLLAVLRVKALSQDEHIGSLVWGGSRGASGKNLRGSKTEAAKCLNL